MFSFLIEGGGHERLRNTGLDFGRWADFGRDFAAGLLVLLAQVDAQEDGQEDGADAHHAQEGNGVAVVQARHQDRQTLPTFGPKSFISCRRSREPKWLQLRLDD